MYIRNCTVLHPWRWTPKTATGLLAGLGGYAHIVILLNSSDHHFYPPKTGAAMAVPEQ